MELWPYTVSPGVIRRKELFEDFVAFTVCNSSCRFSNSVGLFWLKVSINIFSYFTILNYKQHHRSTCQKYFTCDLTLLQFLPKHTQILLNVLFIHRCCS